MYSTTRGGNRRRPPTLFCAAWPKAPTTWHRDRSRVSWRTGPCPCLVACLPVPDSAMSGAPSHAVSWLEDDLLAAVLLVLEDVVAMRCALQRQPVRDDPRRVDLTAFDAFQQRLHVALNMALAGPQGQRPVHPRASRKLVRQPAVVSDDRDDATVAAAHDRLPEGVRPFGFGSGRLLGAIRCVDPRTAVPGFHPHRLDALVGSPAAAHLHQFGSH